MSADKVINGVYCVILSTQISNIMTLIHFYDKLTQGL